MDVAITVRSMGSSTISVVSATAKSMPYPTRKNGATIKLIGNKSRRTSAGLLPCGLLGLILVAAKGVPSLLPDFLSKRASIVAQPAMIDEIQRQISSFLICI